MSFHLFEQALPEGNTMPTLQELQADVARLTAENATLRAIQKSMNFTERQTGMTAREAELAIAKQVFSGGRASMPRQGGSVDFDELSRDTAGAGTRTASDAQLAIARQVFSGSKATRRHADSTRPAVHS